LGTVQKINIFKAYAHFLRQVEFDYPLDVMANVLTQHWITTQTLRDLFHARFSPLSASTEKENCLLTNIEEQLKAITNKDHHEILRRFLNCIQATVRTNFYQEPGREWLSLKFDCGTLVNLPKPSPLYEIFIYAPFMEACHLRSDKISRGGIRWSDRPEDFRNETLSLMKTQTVKNAVIVPLGSKGTFLAARYQDIQENGASAADLKAEVIRCYDAMIRGLLDITDNLIGGNVQHPPQTVCHDGDDPYLVVAADKGTSSFSDLANKIAAEYGFWLGDAFASGGAHGYDHKKMAITSKGAWISIDRHFRELGIDYQETPFTVVGIGDMSGDVFGNGMLRSNKAKLIAAFDHRHIFIDPNPDPAKSFDERRRLFNLENSSWADYNPGLISKGGGVFSRTDKTITLSPEIKQTFGIAENTKVLTPNELISILLKENVDLLWFGGVGTFIKASHESHGDVHDHHNDAIRVDAKDIKATIIGEGANLGVTQKGRIEFALKGGKINTDAIDNSAGVDCSDHEVNLKIFFSHLEQEGKINRLERNQLLHAMTEEVSELILRDNYRQTLILSLMERSETGDLDAYQSLIKYLESDSELPLNRQIECVPSDEEINRRRLNHQGLTSSQIKSSGLPRFARHDETPASSGGPKGRGDPEKQVSSSSLGLTRPELAILLAYAKNNLHRHLMVSLKDSDLPLFDSYFIGYFPKTLQDRFPDDLLNHPLKKEILVTVLANDVMNRMGPCFLHQVCQSYKVDFLTALTAYLKVIQSSDSQSLWENTDNLISIEHYPLFIESMERIKVLTLKAISQNH